MVFPPDCLHPPQRESTPQRMVAQVRELLMQGRLKAGDRLPPERELAETLGVSRPVVREALRILEALGIASVQPGRGAYLLEASEAPEAGLPEGASLQAWNRRVDLWELRLVLEPGLAARAALRGTPEQLAQMETALRAQQESVRQGRSGAREDAAFHLLVAEATGNPFLLKLMRGLAHQLDATRHPVLQQNGRPARSLRENRGILEAITARNPSLALRRMHLHLQNLEQILFSAPQPPDGRPPSPEPLAELPRP